MYFACRSEETSASLPRLTARQSATRASALIPPKRAAAAAWCNPSVARIRFFDGTQPVLTQVPPIVPCPINATRAPSSAAVIAAEKPADPAPMTARSYNPRSLIALLRRGGLFDRVRGVPRPRRRCGQSRECGLLVIISDDAGLFLLGHRHVPYAADFGQALFHDVGTGRAVHDLNGERHGLFGRDLRTS